MKLTRIGDGESWLDVDSEIGRVVSLRLGGVEWLASGARRPTVDDSRFSGAVAWGWDECIPRVAAEDGRDHGQLWGRSCEVVGDRVRSRGDGFELERRFTSDTLRLTVEYRLATSRPVLWSQHALLGDVGLPVVIPNGAVRLASQIGLTAEAAEGLLGGPSDEAVSWPDSAEPWAATLFVPLGAMIQVPHRAGPTMEIDARGDLVGAYGIWVSRGGWPSTSDGLAQTAVEPTSSPTDVLGEAIEQGQAVGPGTWRGRVEFALRDCGSGG